jgi:hypothetical protein
MSVGFQRTIRRYIPEDRFLHNHRYEREESEILYPAVFLAKMFSIPSFILEESLHSDNVAPISLHMQLFSFNYDLVFSSSKMYWFIL